MCLQACLSLLRLLVAVVLEMYTCLLKRLLCAALQARLGLQKDGLPLFRHMLPPALPGLAFVGCEAASFNIPLTAGLQAEWLAGVLAGAVVLPPAADMQDDVRRMTA